MARGARDLAAIVVLVAGSWFQVAWGLLAWRRPRRELLMVGFVANGVLLAAWGGRLAARMGGDATAPDLVILAFLALLAAGLASVVMVAPGLVETPQIAAMSRIPPAAAGAIAVSLALASLAMTPSGLGPSGLGSITAVAAGGSAAVATAANQGPAAVASPTPPAATPRLLVAASTAAPGPTASPPPTPVPSTAATIGPTPAASGFGPSPAPSAGAAASPPGGTRRPAGTPSPTRRSAPATATPSLPSALPATASALPPSAEPSSPSARPSPSPSPSVVPGVPGVITFGSDYNPATLVITGAARTFRIGQVEAWRADLREPAGALTLTFTITQPNPNGPEFPHWQQDFDVPDVSDVVIVNREDLSAYVHGEPGSFIMRIRRGGTGPILAEGAFSVIP